MDVNLWECSERICFTHTVTCWSRQKKEAIYQGLGSQNLVKLRVGAGNADTTDAGEVAVNETFGSRFCIPLDIKKKIEVVKT